MKLFRHSPKDAYLFLYTLAMLALPYYMAVYTEPSVWWILVGAVQSYLIANLQNTSLHHQSHWPMFESARLNSYYEILVSMPCALANQGWKWAHLLHHKYINDQPVDGVTRDPVSVFLRGQNGNPENFWNYTVVQGLFDLKMIFKKTQYPNPALTKYAIQYSREQWAIKFFFASILLINPVYFVCLILVYWAAHAENRAISYGEHWTVLDRRGDTTQDSTSNYGWFVNWLGFGAGHHQEHHHRPGTHWTRYHEITPMLHPNRKLIPGLHIMNNPFWTHFKLLFKKS